MLYSNSLGEKVDFDAPVRDANPRGGKFGTAHVQGVMEPSRLEVRAVLSNVCVVAF